MSFHWSCFIIPLRLEICSFTAILVLSLFYLVYVQKTKKQNKTKQKQKKKEKRKIYKNKCARMCIQYKYSLSSYVDL